MIVNGDVVAEIADVVIIDAGSQRARRELP